MRTRAILFAIAAALSWAAVLCAIPAHSQTIELPCVQIPPTTTSPSPGCQPVTAANPLPVSTSAVAAGSGASGYPFGATPFVQNFDGADTTSQALTFTPPAGQYAYVCGFEVAGLGATAATSVEFHLGTLTGPGGLMFYQYTYPSGATTVSTPVTRTFTPCVRSLNTGSATGFTVPGAAGNTTTYLQMWGYSQ